MSTPLPARSGRVALVAAQARAEVGMTLRQGEQLLVSIGIPTGLLVFFSSVHVLSLGRHPVDFLAPGILALAVMSTAMVSLGIGTGFERSYGVLKRLGSTPLGRPALLVAKTVSVLAVQLVQLAVLVPVALALGWHPSHRFAPAVLAWVAGTAAFAGLGLLMAGTLRATATLALANASYIVLLLLGGMVVPLSQLPGALADVARDLPAAALAGALGAALSGHAVSAQSWLVLASWAVGAPLAAAFTFRWE